MEIKADVKSISELKDYFFLVPDYQREYVWKPDDQVEQFLIDIDNEFEPNGRDQRSYFIGSIILVESKGKFDVIDGQQRLTTIILALSAFRDILKQHNAELDLVGEEYLKSVESLLFSFDLKTKKPTFRLELQYEESKGFLEKLISNKEFDDVKTSSVIRMEQAYEKIQSHFLGYLKAGIDSLLEYVGYFLTNIELVIIKTENLSSALKIFETINQRGAGLNAMDLVKNLLFSEADEDDFQTIKNLWKEITANLQSCNEDNSPLRFLRYFIMARYHNGILREDDLYKWIISAEGKNATKYETQPLDFAKELVKISKRYSELVIATEFMKDGGAFPKITNIGYINKYKSRQHLILLLSLNPNCSTEAIEYLAEQIESFFFYSNSLGIQAKNNERLFVNWAGKLRNKSEIDDIALVIDQTMVVYIKEKVSQFKTEFLKLWHSAYNPLYRLRYFLGKLENTILNKCGLPQQGNDFFNNLQIEHILPQTPKDDVIPETYENIDDYYDNVYRLGNVALLESTINQAVNNFNDLEGDWFEKKQNEYSKSNVTSTNLLDSKFSIGNNTGLNRFKNDADFVFATWDKDFIKKRQEIMLDLAFDAWRFNDKRIDK